MRERLVEEAHENRKQRSNGSMPVRDLVVMLREVRDKWQEVACDDALGNSTQRTQAVQFVRDLTPIIHHIIDPSEP